MRHARKDYERFQDPDGIIPNDEPVFIIRGQDESAPATLRFWADEHRHNGGDEAMAQLIEGWAEEMESWQQQHGSKVADMPPNQTS